MGEGTDGLRFHALMKDEPFIFSNLFHYLFVRGDSGNTPTASWRACGTETWVFFHLLSGLLSLFPPHSQRVKNSPAALLIHTQTPY